MFQILPEHIDEIQRLKGVYTFMKERCFNPENKSYYRYGARGVTVEEPWKTDMQSFVLWCLENNSAPGKQLDRIDNDGPYSPDNCRWVSPQDNANNRSTTKYLTAFGETKSFSEWLSDPRCKYGYALIANRLKLGWDAEKAMTEPLADRTTRILAAYGEIKTWREWLSDPRVEVKEHTLKARMARGWTDEQCLGAVGRSGPRKAGNMITAWGETKIISDWIKDSRVTLKDSKSIWQRINVYRWKPEDAFKAEILRKPKTS